MTVVLGNKSAIGLLDWSKNVDSSSSSLIKNDLEFLDRKDDLVLLRSSLVSACFSSTKRRLKVLGNSDDRMTLEDIAAPTTF